MLYMSEVVKNGPVSFSKCLSFAVHKLNRIFYIYFILYSIYILVDKPWSDL